MDDKCIMENILLTEKGVCDLFLHGTIESSTANVPGLQYSAELDSLCMQDELYKRWLKGWYPPSRLKNRKYRR